MVTETQLLEQGGRAVRDVGSRVVEESGGVLAGIWNGFTAPVRGAWNGLLSWGPKIALLAGGVFLVAPDLVRGLGEVTGRTDLSDAAGQRVREGGVAQVALMAAGAGLIGGSAIGSATTMAQSVVGGGESSAGGTFGSIVGTLVFVGGATVALCALNNRVSRDETGDDTVQVPAAPRAQSPRALNA